jgi:hypothetical protein
MPFGVKVGALKVPVKEKSTAIGALPTVAPAGAGAGAGPAVRSENVGPRIVQKVKAAPVLAPVLSKPVEVKEIKEIKGKGAISAAAAMIMSAAAPVLAKPEEVKVSEVKETSAVSRLGPVSVSGPVSAPVVSAPPGTITTAEWKGAVPVAEFAKMLKGPNPIEITSPEYAPVTSSAFPEFIVQTYSQYSPYLMSILDEAIAAATADGTIDAGGVEKHSEQIKARRAAAPPPEPDRDACKRRNPENRELFHYQKIIRDYLSRGTPYRGLLVYHGLGTGKTCTSIAAAEALYWGGQKKIFVLTPATLSNNYRKDLGKCGYFPLRQNNFWAFLTLPASDNPTNTPAYVWLTSALGLPPALVTAQGGGWIPNPDKPSNWESLSPEVKEAVRAQQSAHLNFRFKFIHYNGVKPADLAALAAKGVETGKQMFDDAVVVIDEVHNLVRTINGTQIGGKPISKIMADPKIEPREATWSTPLARATKGYRYPRAYTLYRLLQNAVGAKIVVLSATPMINYAQELAILLNIIGGEQRMASIPLGAGAKPNDILARIRRKPDVDYAEIEEGGAGVTVLNITPVPFGFSKVVRGDYSTRGFVRGPPGSGDSDVRKSRERNMDAWATSIVTEMLGAGLITQVKVDGVLTDPKATIHTFPLLPDDEKEFVDKFIDKATLQVLNTNILKARSTGLVSYFRGTSEELMPRTGMNIEVKVPMSDYMFKEYSRARLEEIDREGPVQPVQEAGKPFDLYAFATKSKQTGFLSQSRAACNWVFPEEVPRPKMDAKQQAKLLGVEKEKIVDVKEKIND